MNEQTKAQVEAYAEECRTEQLELLRTLGKMPAPTRKEDFRAAFCRDWLRAQGAENVRIDSAKNVICKLGPDTEELVIFAAHTDIVFPDSQQKAKRSSIPSQAVSRTKHPTPRTATSRCRWVSRPIPLVR